MTDIPPDEMRALIRQGAAEGIERFLVSQWRRGTSSLGVWVLRALGVAVLAGLAKLALLYLPGFGK